MNQYCIYGEYNNFFPLANRPALAISAKAQLTIVGDPDYVEDSDLRRLSYDDLHDQCVLRGEQKTESEQHEIEMRDMLDRLEEEKERTIAELVNENMRVKEELTQCKDQLARQTSQNTQQMSMEPELSVSCQHSMENYTLEVYTVCAYIHANTLVQQSV